MSESVWVIEYGEYSDYTVVGVFSTKDNAERAAAAMGFSRLDEVVSEWTLDPGMDQLNDGRLPWHVVMTATGGVVSARSCSDSWGLGRSNWPNPVAARLDRGWIDSNGVLRPGLFVVCDCWATDKEHAVKIANESRIQFRARGEI